MVNSEQKPPPAELSAEHEVGAQYLLGNHVHVMPRLRHLESFLSTLKGKGAHSARTSRPTAPCGAPLRPPLKACGVRSGSAQNS